MPMTFVSISKRVYYSNKLRSSRLISCCQWLLYSLICFPYIATEERDASVKPTHYTQSRLRFIMPVLSRSHTVKCAALTPRLYRLLAISAFVGPFFLTKQKNLKNIFLENNLASQ